MTYLRKDNKAHNNTFDAMSNGFQAKCNTNFVCTDAGDGIDRMPPVTTCEVRAHKSTWTPCFSKAFFEQATMKAEAFPNALRRSLPNKASFSAGNSSASFDKYRIACRSSPDVRHNSSSSGDSFGCRVRRTSSSSSVSAP